MVTPITGIMLDEVMQAVHEGDLRVVREFVNTYDIEDGVEALRTPNDLVRWLRHQKLLAGPVQAADADLTRAVELREAIRELLAANHDGAAGPATAAAAEVLTAAAERAGLRVRFDATTGYRLVPEGEGADAGLGELLVIVTTAMKDGRWRRLKVCRNDTCRWAFFDVSRAGAGKWCSMAVCGNRRKAQAWRARQRTTARPT